MKNKESPNGLQKYIWQLELGSEYISNDAELREQTDDVALYIELIYDVEVKDKFLKLIEPGKTQTSLKRMIAFLHSLEDRLFANSLAPSGKKAATDKYENAKSTKSVFIVHGHDNEAKESVARFISKLGLEPIILHEQSNSGKALIDKLESNAEEISFAVVLLTPDDKGAAFDSSEYKHRARQNVIYELGFFNAKLTRSRVCVLKKGDIEILSDYLGVGYVEMDENGAWKNQLAREIKSAGLPVELEALLS